MATPRRFRKKRRPESSYSPLVATVVTGNRTPASHAIMSTLAVFRGVALSAADLGLRTNCPAQNVLAVLRGLERDGLVRRTDEDGIEATTQSKWQMN